MHIIYVQPTYIQSTYRQIDSIYVIVIFLQMCLSTGVGLGSGSKRKLSFKNVSNVVVQLLHSIKFNVDVPFSNMAASPQELKANAARKVFLIFLCHFQQIFKIFLAPYKRFCTRYSK